MNVFALLLTLLITQILGDNEQNETSTQDTPVMTAESEITLTNNATSHDTGNILALPTHVIRDAIIESELVKSIIELNKENHVETKINPDDEIPLKSTEDSMVLNSSNERSHESQYDVPSQSTIEEIDEIIANLTENVEGTTLNTEDYVNQSSERSPKGDGEEELQENVNEEIQLITERSTAGDDVNANTDPVFEDIEFKSNRRMVHDILENKGKSGLGENDENNENKNSVEFTAPTSNQEVFERSTAGDDVNANTDPVFEDMDFISNRRMVHDILDYKGKSGLDENDENIKNENPRETKEFTAPTSSQGVFGSRRNHYPSVTKGDYLRWTPLEPPDNSVIKDHQVDPYRLQNQNPFRVPLRPVSQDPYQYFRQQNLEQLPLTQMGSIPLEHVLENHLLIPSPVTRTVPTFPPPIQLYQQVPFLYRTPLINHNTIPRPRLIYYHY